MVHNIAMDITAALSESIIFTEIRSQWTREDQEHPDFGEGVAFR